jgi:hypothetical protein
VRLAAVLFKGAEMQLGLLNLAEWTIKRKGF